MNETRNYVVEELLFHAACVLESMKVCNKQQELQGAPPCYTEQNFMDLAESTRGKFLERV